MPPSGSFFFFFPFIWWFLLLLLLSLLLLFWFRYITIVSGLFLCFFWLFLLLYIFWRGRGAMHWYLPEKREGKGEEKREKKKDIFKPAGLGTAGGEVEFKDPTKAVRLTVIELYFMLYICLLNVCSTPFQYAKKSLSCQCDLHQDHNINRPRVYKGSLLDKLFIWQ